MENVQRLQPLSSIGLELIYDLAWSSDNQLAVSIPSSILIYEGENLETVREIPIEDRNNDQIEFIPNSTNLIMWDSIIDTETLEIIADVPNQLEAVSFDGSLAAYSDQDFIYAYSLEMNQVVHQFPLNIPDDCEYACFVYDLAFSPDNTRLAFSSDNDDIGDGIINLETGNTITEIDAGIFNLDYTADGQILVSLDARPGYVSHRMVFSNGSTGVKRTIIHVSALSFDFSLGDTLLAVASLDEDAPNVEEAWGLLHFFDVNQILSAEEADVSIAIHSLETFPEQVYNVKFSPNGRLLATADEGGTLTLWGVPSA